MIGNKVNFILLGILSFMLTNCIREDMSGCIQRETSLVLKFRYAVPSERAGSENIPEVDRLSVFIFDEKGIFISRTDDSPVRIDDNYAMKLPFEKGKFQIVVWAGYCEKSYRLSDLIPGEADIGHFVLYLKREQDNRIVNRPALLYHGIHDTVELNAAEEKIVWIDLKRITNHIRVIARNLPPGSDHTVQIEDTNGAYDKYADFVNDDKITYIPGYADSSDKTAPLIADFTVMKLAPARIPRLQITDEKGTVRYDENLISKLIGENPFVNFEYDHDFTIEITFEGYLPVNIKINGWEIIDEGNQAI